MTLNEALIQEQYQRHLKEREQKRLTIEAEKAQSAKEKADREAYWASKRKIVTVRKEHVCGVCGNIIVKGEKARIVSTYTLVEWKKGFYGDTEGFATYYVCKNCTPMEATV